MWVLSNILLGGILTGAIYSMLALGISLVFNVSGVINLAQGAFVTVGALVMYTFMYTDGLPIGVAILAAIAVMAVMTAIIVWVVVSPALTRVSHSSLLMLMGGLLAAFEGAAFLIWGSNPYSFRPFSGSAPLRIGGLNVPTQAFWIVGTLALCVVALWWFLSRTRAGKALQAASENMNAARLMGIPVDRVIGLAFVASAVLGVLGGAIISPLTSLGYATMANYTNQGVIAVSLGGLGSLFGSVAGGLTLGIAQSLVSGYVSSLWSTALSLVMLVGIITWRPQGILGRLRGSRRDVAELPVGRIHAPAKLPRSWSRGGLALIAVVMLFLPQVLGSSGTLHAVNIVGIFCLTIVGLDLLTGIAGQVSLGQAGFMAVGGYFSAILTVQHGWSPLLALLLGVVASAAVAIVLGAICARLRGMYLAIVTLAFGILAESLASGLTVTGGPDGIIGVPPFSAFGYVFDTDTRFFYLIWGLVAVAFFLTANLVRSNRGRILRAMHGDDTGALALGLNTSRSKVVVFVISAVMASIAGSLYASYFAILSPSMVGSAESLQLMTMLVVGGLGTLFGPLIGVALLTYLPEVSQSIANYAPLADGLLLVAFMRFLPSGLYGGFLDLVAKLRARLSGRPVLAPAGLVPALAGPVQATAAARAMATTALAPAPETNAAVSNEWRDIAPAAAVRHVTPSINGDAIRPASSAPTGPPILRIAELTKAFGGVRAVSDVTFDVGEHSIHAVIGPNGAGKSTLFNLVTNLYRPDHGTVHLGDRCITGLRPDKVTSLGLFRTFQTARIFAQLSVRENVLVGGYRLGRAGYTAQALTLPKSRREEQELASRALALLDAVGLGSDLDAPAHVLPPAGQKYVELARALMARPTVMLLDEPGAGMNDAETAELGTMLRAIRDLGHTVVVVDHNMALVMGIADQVAVMDAGQLIAVGPPEEIQRDPVVIDAYFGREGAPA